MKKQKDKNLNNEGFTLVELLIAVAIVAVIVAPILTAINTSMKVNKKSDDLLNETAVAQTFMEGMQDMKLEDIAEQFSQRMNPDNTLEFLPSELIVTETEHKEYQNSFVEEDGEYVFQKSTSNIYVFGAENIEYDGKKYDVKVTLDAKDYYKDETKGETDDKLNDTMYVDISDYDSEYDGLYVQSSNVNSELCSKLALKCMAANIQKTADDIEQEAERTITVNITNTPVPSAAPGSSDALIEVDVNYKLEIPQDYVGRGVQNWADQNFNAIYKNTEDTSMKPRNIYILYNPNYNSEIGRLKDSIVINNEGNIPVTVYLIKQSSVEEYTLERSEAGYCVDITINEGTKGAEYATKLRTNLGYNLYNLLESNEYKRLEQQVQKLVYDCNGVKTEYTGTGSVPSDSIYPNFYAMIDTITGKSNETVRIFKKKVEVYSSDSYKNDFLADDGSTPLEPLATLDSYSITPTP